MSTKVRKNGGVESEVHKWGGGGGVESEVQKWGVRSLKEKKWGGMVSWSSFQKNLSRFARIYHILTRFY